MLVQQRSLVLYSFIHIYLRAYVYMHTVYRGSRLKTAKASGDATASRTVPNSRQ
jgi:hypothetical protein